jgi:hypothetical protein
MATRFQNTHEISHINKRVFTDNSSDSCENKCEQNDHCLGNLDNHFIIEGNGFECHRQFEVISILHISNTKQKIDHKSINYKQVDVKPVEFQPVDFNSIDDINSNLSSNCGSPHQSFFSINASSISNSQFDLNMKSPDQIGLNEKWWTDLINSPDMLDSSRSFANQSNFPINSDLISDLSVNSTFDGESHDELFDEASYEFSSKSSDESLSKKIRLC